MSAQPVLDEARDQVPEPHHEPEPGHEPEPDAALDMAVAYDRHARLAAGLAARSVNWPEYFEQALPHDRPLAADDLSRLGHQGIWAYRLLGGCLLCLPRAVEYALTWHDLQEGPEERRWVYELIGAALIVSPNSPSEEHQSCAFSIAMVLRQACPPEFKTMIAPFEVVSEAPFAVQPDVLVARRPLGGARLVHAPVLVVEVLSRGTTLRDRGIKQIFYERAGVQHYWIVSPDGPVTIEARRLVDGEYALEAVVAGGETFSTELPFAVSFTPLELLDAGTGAPEGAD